MNGVAILIGLNKLDKHVYGGTVKQSVIDKRRAKNRNAAKQRRINRQRDVYAR